MKNSVLIVDDKPANLLVLEALLSANYRLIPAHSGQEALNLLKQEPVDLILLDVQMPVMDGFETALRIKQLDHCRDIPIVFVSGVYTDDPYIKKAFQCGALDYF